MVLRVGQSGDTGNGWCLVWVSMVTQVIVPRVCQSGDTGNGASCGSVW